MQKRKVKCPFCPFHTDKDRMVTHIEKKHPDMIPKGYTAARVLFNHLNHKTHGTCVVCKRPTPWDENTRKYKRLCGRPECRQRLREQYQKNMVKVYGTDNILTDMDQQKKMLAGRRISGKYQFQDGTYIEYTGEYERKLLVFLDKVMGFPGYDIITPGPQFEYQYNGETHVWITDVLIVPYNLVIDVKDGGDNPNRRSMPDYRAKQLAKEQMITDLGKYNYLRLTNNQFEQLIEIIYQLKIQMIDDNEENRNVIISINEEINTIKSMIKDLRANHELGTVMANYLTNDYLHAKIIYDSLTPEERKNSGIGIEYKDVSYEVLAYRKVEYGMLHDPKGFVDVYRMKKNGKYSDINLYLLVIVRKFYRRQGVAKALVQQAIKDVIAKNPREKRNFYWRCERKNKPSLALALKCGFKLIDTTKTQCVLRYTYKGK